MSTEMSQSLRAGEVAVEAPAATDASLVFIGRIRTPGMFDLAWRGLGVSCWTAGREDEAIAAWDDKADAKP
jgi:hypothetical protein